MSQGWHKVADVKAFLQTRGTKRVRPHDFSARILHWLYCKHCGLMLLKNEPTRRSAAKLCVVEE